MHAHKSRHTHAHHAHTHDLYAHMYTCTHWGRMGHLAKFCYDRIKNLNFANKFVWVRKGANPLCGDKRGRIIAGVGVVFISPQNHILPRAFSLTESCSNNVAEYNALLIGVQLAHGIGVRYLKAYGDSKRLSIRLKANMRSVTRI